MLYFTIFVQAHITDMIFHIEKAHHRVSLQYASDLPKGRQGLAPTHSYHPMTFFISSVSFNAALVWVASVGCQSAA